MGKLCGAVKAGNYGTAERFGPESSERVESLRVESLHETALIHTAQRQLHPLTAWLPTAAGAAR